jgi:hypothetical protein
MSYPTTFGGTARTENQRATLCIGLELFRGGLRLTYIAPIPRHCQNRQILEA